MNEHIDAISLAGGEADEERRLEVDVRNVFAATRRLVTGLTNLTWVTSGYGWFTLGGADPGGGAVCISRGR